LTIGEHVRSGAVLPMAISGPDRLKSFPSIPTFVEMGYSEMVGTTWFGLSGPKHMPPDLVDRLNREVRAILARPDVMAKLVGDSTVIPDMDVAAFNAFYAEEVVRWANAAKKAGLRLQN
jgi:tripartite-type tricarboxylate transporter receptor subunit TctC